MNFRDLLIQNMTENKRILINGMGTGTTQGLIKEVQDDYIVYELTDVQTEKNSSKVKTTKETKYILISDISEISTGEKVEVKSPLDGLK
jgi:uncharacterized protein YdbL (DUF1318 family)